VPREPLAIPLREARAPLVLALDTGTSGLRVLLFDVSRACAPEWSVSACWKRRSPR